MQLPGLVKYPWDALCHLQACKQLLNGNLHAGAAIHAHLQYIMPPLLTLAGNTSAAAAAVEAAQKTLRSVRYCARHLRYLGPAVGRGELVRSRINQWVCFRDACKGCEAAQLANSLQDHQHTFAHPLTTSTMCVVSFVSTQPSYVVDEDDKCMVTPVRAMPSRWLQLCKRDGLATFVMQLDRGLDPSDIHLPIQILSACHDRH